MRSTYDPEADAAYFYIVDRIAPGGVSVSEQVADNIVFDRDDQGRLLGIEVLNASHELAAGAWSEMPSAIAAE